MTEMISFFDYKLSNVAVFTVFTYGSGLYSKFMKLPFRFTIHYTGELQEIVLHQLECTKNLLAHPDHQK